MTDEKKDELTSNTEQSSNSGSSGGATVTTANAQNELILAKLREVDERTRANEQALQSTKEQLDRKPEVTLDDKNKAFWANPMGVLQETLNKTVQPLIEFRDEFKAGSAYDRVKSSFKSDPRFREFLSVPAIEAQVDSLMEKNAPTKENYLGVLLGLRGGIELGLVPRPEGYKTEQNKSSDASNKTETKEGNEKVNTMIPPHLRPSSAPTPKAGEEKAKLPELNENEERLRKENNLTHAEFIQLRDEVGPMDVTNWKSEKELAKEKK